MAYCNDNGLEVNTSKTKIIHFRNGKTKAQSRESVSKYDYFGLHILSRGSLIWQPQKIKERRPQGWGEKHIEAVDNDTTLYEVNQTDSTEKAQLYFLKSILKL